jgi:hypothetical protein
MGPRPELREPGVNYLATQEDAGSSPSPSPQLPTPEAANMQRSPVVNIGTLPAPTEPEDRGADWDPLLHDPPPPDVAAESPTHHPPEQIRAPTESGGQSESLRDETLQGAIGQTSPEPVRAQEGKTPVGEVHGRPPDFANPQTQGSIIWEPGSIDPKAHVRAHQARRPVLDEGARMRPSCGPIWALSTAARAKTGGPASTLTRKPTRSSSRMRKQPCSRGGNEEASHTPSTPPPSRLPIRR